MEIKSVGVVGAGQMGSGIAHVFALAGYDVRLTDVSREALERARTGMERALARQVERDRLTEADRAAALARLTLEEDLAALGPADLVIEAATEREAVKHAIFAGLAPTLAPHTILTSNTSSISITRLAAATDRPERFMGLHFMNPVPVMQLVELIRGIQTDEATYRTLVGVVERLGKTHTSAEDFPAFIVNRILMPMINEAVYTLYEGVGSVTAIDASLKLGANHPMGPLELADLIGLDTCLAIMNVLHEGLADTKYRPCPLLVKYVEAGWLGRKTRRGFYDYRGRGAGADPVTERRFTAADQEAFAALSGDRNPMHMDAAAARRTQAGTCAVHGVAATLWALEALAAEAPLAGLAALKAEFQGFIPVDAPVALGITARSPDRLRAEIRRDGARAIALDLRLAPASAAPGSNRGRLDAPADPVPPAALDRRFEELEGAAGALAASEGATAEAAARYPRLAAALGPERVAALALASTLVGMVAPGLHSIFSGLTVAFGPGDGRPPVLAWHLARADARFRLVTLEVAAPGFVGSLRAFVRFPPVAPPAFAAAAARVPPGAFAGRHALVVGGSRGLGAATALLLAAGGAAITLTYRSGRDEAEAVAAAIADAGGVARILPYDATAPAAAQLAGLAPVTDCFYFATGQIADGASAYRRARLDAFLAVYADGFAALVEALLAAAPDRPLHAFYPSSVFVEARPAGMTEYAMAKAAGEVLAAELARGRRRLTVSVPRLPRVLTDQTATVPPVPAADPLEVMAATLLGDGPTG